MLKAKPLEKMTEVSDMLSPIKDKIAFLGDFASLCDERETVHMSGLYWILHDLECQVVDLTKKVRKVLEEAK